MKLLLESDDVEHVHALREHLTNAGIPVSVTGEQTFATSPGAVLKVGLWVNDDARYAEALACIEEFERSHPAQRPSAADFGRPVLAQRTGRLARWVLVSSIVILGLYLLAQAYG